MPFQIVRNNIADMCVDAIVNAANNRLQMGSGVCGAIFSAAGAIELQRACDEIGGCATGDAVITPGFNLPAKWVIHAVGPIWQGGNHNEEALLRSAYTRSLELARAKNLRSIAFPLISSGVYGYPKAEALNVALSAIRAFLMDCDDMDVWLVVFDHNAFTLSESLVDRVKSYIDEHFVRRMEQSYSRSRRMSDEAAFTYEEASFSNTCEPLNAPMPAAAPPKEAAAPQKPKLRSLDKAIRSLDQLLSRRREETFSEMLLRLVDEKGFAKDSIVYKRANIERSVFSKLRSNKNYTPSKSTAIALCIALELNMDQTKDLLARAGYALSPSSLSDVIIAFFIENGLYDIFEINATLFKYDQPCLGAKG